MVHPSGFSNRAWMENSKKKTTFFLKMGAKPERQDSLDTTVTQLDDRFKPVHTKVNTVVFVFLEKNSLKNLNGKSRWERERKGQTTDKSLMDKSPSLSLVEPSRLHRFHRFHHHTGQSLFYCVSAGAVTVHWELAQAKERLACV